MKSALAALLRFIHEQGLLLKLADRIEFGGQVAAPQGYEYGDNQA